MPLQTIRHNAYDTVLFCGLFPDMRQCLEQAVRDNVCLDGADLRHENLAHAALDDAILRGARLDGANLIDANLSEAVLDDACLQGASLQNACFYGASLRRACFTDAAFGATDIGGARIDGAIFSTLSALLLNFRSCETMEACRFIGPAEETSVFSQPPIVISGLPDIIAFIGPHIKIGQKEYFCHKKMLTEEK